MENELRELEKGLRTITNQEWVRATPKKSTELQNATPG